MTKNKSTLLLPFLMFSVAAFFYLYEFLLRVVPSVMRPQLAEEFGLNATQFGVFASCYFWSYAPLQLPAGAWVDKFGPRRLLTFAIFLCAFSTLIAALTKNYHLALLSRFLIGAGSAFAFVCCIKISSTWFDEQVFPLMVGVTLTIGTLGAASSAGFSVLTNFIDWRHLLILIGVIGVLLAFVAFLTIRDENPARKVEANEVPLGFWYCLKIVVQRPQSWLIGLYALLTTAPTDALGGAWGVTFLVDAHHINKDLASIAQAMTFVGMAFGSPLLGGISAYFDNRKVPMFIAALIAAVALTALIYSPFMNAILAMILFFVFGAAGTYVLAFVMIEQNSDFRFVGTAVGFVNMLSVMGSMILTWVIGCILDTVRSQVDLSGMPVYTLENYHVGLLILPVFYLVSALLIVPLIKDSGPRGIEKL